MRHTVYPQQNQAERNRQDILWDILHKEDYIKWTTFFRTMYIFPTMYSMTRQCDADVHSTVGPHKTHGVLFSFVFV